VTVDHVGRIGAYAPLLPALAAIAAFVEISDLSALPPGRHPLPDGIVLIREDYLTRPFAECTLEGHRRHADLQLVLSGEEAIGWLPIAGAGFVMAVPYDAEKDVEKYRAADVVRVGLPAGTFALVFPADLHMPKLSLATPTAVQKAVFKIPLREE